MDSHGSTNPKNVLPDLIIPILALAFIAYYLSTITEVPWIAQASAVTVSCLLILAILAYFLRTAIRVRKGQETLDWHTLWFDKVAGAKRIVLLMFTVIYVLALEPLGFTLATTVFIFLGIVLLSSIGNWKRAAIISVCCSVTGYVVFIYFFKTRFPKGIIENTLAGLL
jgi:hypothetical protein